MRRPTTIRRSFGGYGDFDIFYRGLSPAPAPSGTNNGLHLVSNTDDARYDNMQVPASSYLNFTSQMTGEVWVRPYAGGKTTGTTSVISSPSFTRWNRAITSLTPCRPGISVRPAPGPGPDPND